MAVKFFESDRVDVRGTMNRAASARRGMAFDWSGNSILRVNRTDDERSVSRAWLGCRKKLADTLLLDDDLIDLLIEIFRSARQLVRYFD